MKIPIGLEQLLHDGLIDEVISPLMSGKEAAVYVVRSGGEICCAKVYKEANHRSFRTHARYREGRKGRDSRQARAIAKRTRHGRQEQEEAWHNAEVDALYRLAAAGVRVPQPYACVGGVLLMEMITDVQGNPAPRLSDLELPYAQARDYHRTLIAEVVRMLCAGIVHGDLSEYNVLVDSQGPVIIDLPQAIDAAGNNHAATILERDVANLAGYFGHFAPELLTTRYGKEMWHLYESGELHPETQLTGRFKDSETRADVAGVMDQIDAAREEADRRQGRAPEAEKPWERIGTLYAA
ncbi:MAG: serine protein kinase RIO [Deferrisomatales bacterium]|nr:serine protein kinase RIO [Deferrisomatales bacterium]